MNYFTVHEILVDIAVILTCFRVDCKRIYGDGWTAHAVFSISFEDNHIELSVTGPDSDIFVQS